MIRTNQSQPIEVETQSEAEELMASGWKFRALFEKGPVGMSFNKPIYDEGGKLVDFQVLDANESYVRITGVDPRGKTIRQAFQGIENDPFDWIGTYGRVGETGVPVSFEQFFKGDNRWYDCFAYKYAEPNYFIVAFLDITARKQTERELLLAHERLALAQQAANAGVWDWEMNPERVIWSPELYRLFGVDLAEGGSSFAKWRSLVHPDDLVDTEALIHAAVRDRVPLNCSHRIIRPSGELRWIEIVGDTTYAEDGTPLRMIGICLDITEKKQAEQEKARREELLLSERAARIAADRTSRLKNEFLSTLSHELRTPLNAILGWAQLLKRAGGKPELMEEGLAVISRNAQAQATLIEDLLDMSRIESGQLRLELQDVVLQEVIASAVASVDPDARPKEIRIQSHVPEVPVVVRGDPDRVQQVVCNFLTNAIKFSSNHGRITVRLTPRETQVEISVEDDGQGIREEFLPHVFDRFRQQDSTTTRRQGGMGIGLALVKELVELHGGSVRVASEGEGRGSIFTASLPLPKADVGRPSCEDSAETPDPSRRLEGISILVIDDEPDALQLVYILLTREGANVISATNAMEGFSLLQSARPDLILSDIGMPNHDGCEFIQWVRQLPPDKGGRTPAAALTAFARSEDRERIIQAGFQFHLVKPLRQNQLIDTVLELARKPQTASGLPNL